MAMRTWWTRWHDETWKLGKNEAKWAASAVIIIRQVPLLLSLANVRAPSDRPGHPLTSLYMDQDEIATCFSHSIRPSPILALFVAIIFFAWCTCVCVCTNYVIIYAMQLTTHPTVILLFSSFDTNNNNNNVNCCCHIIKNNDETSATS